MARTIKHAFVSAIPDDQEPGLMSPNDWNADHVIVNTPRTVLAAGSVTVFITDADLRIAKTVAEATTIILPAAATFLDEELVIKDLNGVCLTFNFAVTPFAGENIDGLTSYPMVDNYALLRLRPKTNGWCVVGQ